MDIQCFAYEKKKKHYVYAAFMQRTWRESIVPGLRIGWYTGRGQTCRWARSVGDQSAICKKKKL